MLQSGERLSFMLESITQLRFCETHRNEVKNYFWICKTVIIRKKDNGVWT